MPLKYLSNFWRFRDLPLINCEIELDLSWSKESIISEISKTAAVAANPPNPAREVTERNSSTFQENNIKLYVLVFTLSKNDNIKFLENIKQGFTRTISWNKQRCEITIQPKNNNLDYLIDPTFININRLFVLLTNKRLSFNKCYVQLVEIKNFNALIDTTLLSEIFAGRKFRGFAMFSANREI